jgi:class 3 adenylate cyclase
MSDKDENKAVRGPGDTEGDPQTASRTFLIADVRGYTRFTHEHGDEEGARIAAFLNKRKNRAEKLAVQREDPDYHATLLNEIALPC